MLCSITVKSQAQRRYIARCWLGAMLVIVLCLAAAFVFRMTHLHGLLAYAVALTPALPILWVIIATGRYLAEETDEFQRNLYVQCILGGIGGTLATTTTWGYLEDFARVPRLDLVWVYAIFWLFAAITYPIVYRRYR